jgi:hypothetical protein
VAIRRELPEIAVIQIKNVKGVEDWAAAPEKDFGFLAAGSAAEVLTYDEYDEDGARADKVAFARSDAPSYDEAVKEAQTLLLQKKRTLKRLVSMLKTKCLRADLNIANLVERGMDGSDEKFAELMSEAELREAISRK